MSVCLPLVVGCASSGSRSQGERVSGYFDEGESDNDSYRGGGGGGGYAPASTGSAYPAAPPPAAGAAPTDAIDIAAEESVSAGRDFIDFAGDMIEGALVRPDGNKLAESRPEPSKPAEPPPPRAGEPVPGDKLPSDKPPVESSAAKRLVIYKGSLVVLVAGVEPAVEKLSARVNELGGYVENQSGNSGANNATLTMRVPAEKFYALVNELGGYGQVTQKNVSASDVTKTVFDIELRLETAEKSRQRLLDLLKVATKMEEILQIEGEVRRLTQEIEGMKGELRFLKDQVAFSTLAVTFYSNAPPPNQGPTRTRSRFEWINQVGVESVLYNF